MMKFGGHKQAAGLTIETARIRELRAPGQRRTPTIAWGRTTCGRGSGSTAR